jgi:hypothetical protein
VDEFVVRVIPAPHVVHPAAEPVDALVGDVHHEEIEGVALGVEAVAGARSVAADQVDRLVGEGLGDPLHRQRQPRRDLVDVVDPLAGGGGAGFFREGEGRALGPRRPRQHAEPLQAVVADRSVAVHQVEHVRLAPEADDVHRATAADPGSRGGPRLEGQARRRRLPRGQQQRHLCQRVRHARRRQRLHQAPARRAQATRGVRVRRALRLGGLEAVVAEHLQQRIRQGHPGGAQRGQDQRDQREQALHGRLLPFRETRSLAARAGRKGKVREVGGCTKLDRSILPGRTVYDT